MDNEPAPISEPAALPTESELPPPRLCSYQVKFQGGVESHEQAERIADTVHALAYSYSRYFPLEKIDGITFAEDYGKALSELDRGFGAISPLTATSESFAMGVAMSPTVLRDGVVKTHIVMNAGLGQMLISKDLDAYGLAAHTIVHEFGHASFNQLCDEALPGVMLKPIEDRYEGYLYPYSCGCLDEYVATRDSAFLGKDVLSGYQATLVSICNQARDRLVAAREGYRSDRDFNKLSEATLSAISAIMKFSGYVLGHADGANEAALDADGKLEEALGSLMLLDWFDNLHSDLRNSYAGLSNLQKMDDLMVLNRSLEEGVRIHCVFPSRMENGEPRVDIENRVFWMDA